MPKFQKTKFTGVFFLESEKKKHGIRKDRCFYIRHKVNGKVVDERVGWWSQGVTADLAAARLADLKKHKRDGSGPITLKEQHTENKAGRTAEEARKKAEIEAQKTLSEYWTESYYPVAQRSKKQCSWSKEELHFRKWISPILGTLPMRDIGLKQWDELVKTLSAAGLSPRSKEYITGTLRRILKHAYDRRMVDDPPPTGKRVGVSGPGNNRRLRVVSHEEERAIMDLLAAFDVHAWRVTRFAFLTGCRASEAFDLTWSGVDFSMGRITFPETKNRDPRAIPLTPQLQELFDGMQTGPPDRRVFVKADGKPYLQAPSAFETVVEHLGFNEGRTKRDRVVFHSIRHTVATRLAQRLGPRDLMDVMGWRTVQMAMRYVHANEGAKLSALSMLGVVPEVGRVLPFAKGGAE